MPDGNRRNGLTIRHAIPSSEWDGEGRALPPFTECPVRSAGLAELNFSLSKVEYYLAVIEGNLFFGVMGS